MVEADRNKTKSVCCGAGGGRMWMEEEPEHRVNEMRVGQLLEKDPEIIGVNCPYCLTMMEDGIGAKGKGDSVKAFDLAEILVAQLAGAPRGPGARAAPGARPAAAPRRRRPNRRPKPPPPRMRPLNLRSTWRKRTLKRPKRPRLRIPKKRKQEREEGELECHGQKKSKSLPQ